MRVHVSRTKYDFVLLSFLSPIVPFHIRVHVLFVSAPETITAVLETGLTWMRLKNVPVCDESLRPVLKGWRFSFLRAWLAIVFSAFQSILLGGRDDSSPVYCELLEFPL
jgi:hypothetical protein